MGRRVSNADLICRVAILRDEHEAVVVGKGLGDGALVAEDADDLAVREGVRGDAGHGAGDEHRGVYKGLNYLPGFDS